MTPFIESFRKMRRQSEPAMTVPCALWAAGALFAVLSASAAQSGEYRVDRASVLERGIFQASSRSLPAGHSSFGPVAKFGMSHLFKARLPFLHENR